MKNTLKLLIFFFYFFTLAQSEESNKEMDKLSILEGKWIIENYENKEGERWINLGTSYSNIKLEHSGKFISERNTYLTSNGEINMITHIGFDRRINAYKLSAMDKEYGLMDIYTGKWEEERLIFTNLTSDQPILLNNEKKLSFRVSYFNLSKNSFEHLVEGTLDEGKTWFVFSKSKYNRRKKN
ncbi:hypothetical protein [uncultured Winogradskyella sp.]|uniref:hypothetical protein n=1 Tax=uncultured Winogradskyella sp. TaxID=395353 RepID=UPI00260E183C|nr:hypothetical protein [uncultured Winogradskyella sp.]